MGKIIFEAKKVSKVFENTTIIKDLDLTLSAGEAVAIVGHNGSGKSSLLKLIGSIYEPTTGNVKRLSCKVGYVPEHFPENLRFKIKEYLILVGEMSGRSKRDLEHEIPRYADIFRISEYLETSIRNCSKGTKQKVGIIQALLQRPNLLLLDEPLTGLDGDAQSQLLEQLILVKKDTTIIFTAHETLLIDGLADQKITIENGEIVAFEKTWPKIRKRLIRVKVHKEEILMMIKGIEKYQINKGIATLTALEENADRVLMELLSEGCSILEVKEKR